MKINIEKDYAQKTCGTCGVTFFIPAELENEFLKTGQAWACPNGHRRAYAESEADKYKRLYEQSEQYRQNAVKQNDYLKADVAALEKALARAKAKKPRKQVAKS